MTNLLIRDVPEQVLVAIDANAKRLGLSRSEYLRRQLAAAAASGHQVSADDLADFAETFSDLGDADVMRQAWE
jgi:sulfite reductase beta subunit-like hemoprotein